MATDVHCLYCFEALASYLEKREAMTLEEVEKSYASYNASRDTAASSTEGQTKRIPALRRLADDSSGSGSGSSNSSSSVSLGADTAATSTSSLDETSSVTITESPLFVTWNTISSKYGSSLRGCIGTFEAQDLDEGLSSYALTSALHDTRFNPISARELPSLEVAVTLLTDFEDADDAMDWELGQHGLRLTFNYNGKRYSSTYLPDVATEQGWTKEETVVSLMRKAGWVGDKRKWRDVDLTVVRYQGKKHELSYVEYKRWHDWAEKEEKSA